MQERELGKYRVLVPKGSGHLRADIARDSGHVMIDEFHLVDIASI